MKPVTSNRKEVWCLFFFILALVSCIRWLPYDPVSVSLLDVVIDDFQYAFRTFGNVEIGEWSVDVLFNIASIVHSIHT